jgi:hypothetical protein
LSGRGSNDSVAAMADSRGLLDYSGDQLRCIGFCRASLR